MEKVLKGLVQLLLFAIICVKGPIRAQRIYRHRNINSEKPAESSNLFLPFHKTQPRELLPEIYRPFEHLANEEPKSNRNTGEGGLDTQQLIYQLALDNAGLYQNKPLQDDQPESIVQPYSQHNNRLTYRNQAQKNGTPKPSNYYDFGLPTPQKTSLQFGARKQKKQQDVDTTAASKNNNNYKIENDNISNNYNIVIRPQSSYKISTDSPTVYQSDNILKNTPSISEQITHLSPDSPSIFQLNQFLPSIHQLDQINQSPKPSIYKSNQIDYLSPNSPYSTNQISTDFPSIHQYNHISTNLPSIYESDHTSSTNSPKNIKFYQLMPSTTPTQSSTKHHEYSTASSSPNYPLNKDIASQFKALNTKTSKAPNSSLQNILLQDLPRPIRQDPKLIENPVIQFKAGENLTPKPKTANSKAAQVENPLDNIHSVNDLINSNASCVEPPFKCPHPRIQFFLYTRATQDEPELLDTTDRDSLYQSQFNPTHQTKVIIHGFQGGRNQSPSTDLRKAYFTRGDYNIIIVDYSSLVQVPCVPQIEWSPRFCGKCIAQMVAYLSTHPRGVPPDKLHLMGYSIGAHIAGLTANYVTKGKLGRITGLDPTIIFYMGSNRSRDLDPTDAHFVDVIHTAAGVLGQWGPSGHADFYVNGGSSQPGCASSSLIETLSCDHTKVTPYFIESITTPLGFWAVPCPNRFFYSVGWCTPRGSEYVLMGEDVSHAARGIFYLETNGRKPYAKGLPGKKLTAAARQRFG